ncbi:MAG: class I SAM-dependent DNA methyltransferase [Candidatus Contendobacter sp.]|nr:class I SAM-dependent DNA methyltransferase [Candidatus Contendobacter sp.]
MPTPALSPQAFIATWRDSTLKERSAAQSHFNDLCRLLGEPTPTEADPHGEWFCFEKGVKKTGGGDGWADVWRKGCFAWEYKGKHKDLGAALRQLRQYALALDNPPLLIVCDLDAIEIHTHFTNSIHTVYRLALTDLANPAKLDWLRWAFTDPERLKPGQTRQRLTEDAAERFAGLAQGLRAQGHAPRTVAHFINRLVFCMFAEDVGLLPDRLFTRLLEHAASQPSEFAAMASDLFRAMRAGGRIGFEKVEWFNGGLFDSDEALSLDRPAIEAVLKAARLDWSDIDPSIFGTLFERGLDPDKRSQLGAHYTDRDKIGMLVEPVIVRPLQTEWVEIKTRIAERLAKAAAAKTPATATNARKAAQDLHDRFLERLRQVRILDPACGSGNFLYLALLALKDFEHQTHLDAEALGLGRQFPSVGPECVWGIEINPYAAELARVTVWIGEIQWMRRNGFEVNRQPILRALDTIECRDALLDLEGREAEWPAAEFIVGNPPFLGDKKQLAELGEDYVATLRRVYAGRVSGGADLVCYWFEKARAQIEAGQTQRAGLVATNSIRQKRNRPVLERISKTGAIFDAWSDQPWINDGAAVRVSLVCFGRMTNSATLDGRPVAEIHADLTGRALDAASGLDLTQARSLPENAGCSFFGLCLAGAFAVDSATARQWLRQPNPHSRPNSEVLRPIWNGVDVTQGWKGRWVIDFGTDLSESEAALYEAPFAHVLAKVKPVRMSNREKSRVEYWWRHGRPRPELRRKLAGLTRYIATSETAKHRIFVWLPVSVAPEHKLVVIARDDDETFGILSSRFHIVWATALGGRLGVGNDPVYNSTRCFETFPFPTSLTPNFPASVYADDPRAQAIAAAARKLNELRENWLNPPEWVDRVPEVVPGYPDRLIPKPEHAAELKKRTLTNLYNAQPAWLINAHRALDEAVATAYGWPMDLNDDEVLRRLLTLNRERTLGTA